MRIVFEKFLGLWVFVCIFLLISLFFCFFFFKAGIKDIDRYHEKLAVSLYSSSLPPHLSGIKLGVISSEELPLYYR